jgi:1,4-dihydroxy-2-naphthoate octaprenyltransferase
MNLVELFYIFLFSIPAINGIANIMLANNICDVDEDILNKRFTLPYYIGRENALKLFAALYYIGFLDTVALTLLGIAPPISLLILLALIPVQRNIRLFQVKPNKSETFVLSVQNFAVMNVAQILSVGAMLVVNALVLR